MIIAFFCSPLNAQDSKPIPGLHTPLQKLSIKEVKASRYKQLVQFEAQVKKIKRDNDFIAADATGSVEVDINEMPLPISKGDTLTIIGRVDKDWGVEIYATEIKKGDQSFRIPRRSEEKED